MPKRETSVAIRQMLDYAREAMAIGRQAKPRIRKSSPKGVAASPAVADGGLRDDRSDLVAGKYELVAPKDKTTIAVKITDMLGEEVLTLHTV